MSGLLEARQYDGATRYFRYDPNPLGAYVEVSAHATPGLFPTGFSTSRLSTETDHPLMWDIMCDVDKHNWLVEHGFFANDNSNARTENTSLANRD